MFSFSQLNKSTRTRGKNFAVSEELLLLELIQPYKHIIDNKCSDATSCQLKKDTWENLAHQFSKQSGFERTWRTLKDKYKNMNSKLKTEGTMIPRFFKTKEFEPASNCVSVVYDNSPGHEYSSDNSPDNKHQYDQDDGIESPTFVEESINKALAQETPESQSSFSPIKKTLPRKCIISKRNKNRSLTNEKIALIRLQQRFYCNENVRSAEKHRLELKSINLKNELMELELEEKRRRIKNDEEHFIKTDSLS
ncbi:myb/SANT-like DNA-binding domain-containing protein 3 [Drosophila elegans]|uniref:myb/SANT-like DNA-binding domain-containing protein 3 n=1 Tax=Drosophila elegans TaxID=30023 RepID=UPI0007E62780|nr:myb/SANT-like DNA-binding domain-containing protein 3 [Drosophila elegans]